MLQTVPATERQREDARSLTGFSPFDTLIQNAEGRR